MFGNIIHTLGKAIVSTALFTSSILGFNQEAPHQEYQSVPEVIQVSQAPTESVNLGAAIQTVADFRTSLASSITANATEMTLVSFATRDGTNLTVGSSYGFKLGGSEFVIGTASTSNRIAGLTRGVSVVSGTSSIAALQKPWGRGTAVEMTDAPIILDHANKISGNAGFDQAIKYDAGVSTTTLSANGQNIASVAYANSLAFGAVPAASETAGGFVELATGQEAASTTSLGGTGARLVIPASAATSTKPSSGHYAVITKSDGSIDSNYFSAIVPTGTIVSYISSTPPSGWLNLDGSAVSRTTYSTLFAIIGTTYGTGDGSTTFNLPDMKGRVAVGYSATAPTKVWTFASRSSNTITVTGATNATSSSLQTGQPVVYTSSGSVITGLTSGTTYYLVRSAYNQFSLATNVDNANSGIAISLSSDGSGTQTFTATFTARPLAETGGTETLTQVPSHRHTTNAEANTNGSGPAGSGSGPNDASTINATGSDNPNNMQLYTVLNYIIKF